MKKKKLKRQKKQKRKKRNSIHIHKNVGKEQLNMSCSFFYYFVIEVMNMFLL